ncbi:hypothetical protein FE257_009857 [Aspergillus nanangensis]|uniref:Uncharacterized protein n=1 Tax=Aspergillus nanangensis TaxID=2582783 RepID=A0AAD4CVW8_ASPNN|nr:hypothetical protein FE257_009857 [Aspergillus nanangensis]
MSGSERRRSAAGVNLNQHNNPNGETGSDASSHRTSFSQHALRTSSPTSLGGSPLIATGDPHHQRAPSLGELHQELENEQEAQVNRLLQMIRSQQSQLDHLQQQHQHPSQSAAVDDSAQSDRSSSIPFVNPSPAVPPLTGSGSRASSQVTSSLSNRRPSRPSSQTPSPSLRPLADFPRGPEALEWVAGASEHQPRRSSRDESAFYQAEAAMLSRENQILRQRIRDLERQVSELTIPAGRSAAPPGTSADPHIAPSAAEPTDKT